MPTHPKSRKSKYPKIDHGYESADYPGLYYAGAVTHSLDLRKSAGGFIHGFRYTGGHTSFLVGSDRNITYLHTVCPVLFLPIKYSLSVFTARYYAARTMLSQDVCPSVHPSVRRFVRHTPVLCRNGSPYRTQDVGSYTILVFPYTKRYRNIPTGTSLAGAVLP